MQRVQIKLADKPRINIVPILDVPWWGERTKLPNPTAVVTALKNTARAVLVAEVPHSEIS